MTSTQAILYGNPTQRQKPLCDRLVEVLESHQLEQIQWEHTCEQAWIDYINGILQAGLDEGNPKTFWHCIFSQRNERKTGNCTQEDRRRLSKILNKQFKSIFSVDEPGSDTVLSGFSYPPIDRLLISVQRVEKLLTGLNPNRATGPDQVHCRILKELSTTLAPVLAAIFTQSLETGTLSSAWKTAFISTICKKAATRQAENYRPVSLTCITCKMLEHIICDQATWTGIASCLHCNMGLDPSIHVRHSFLPPCMTCCL